MSYLDEYTDVRTLPTGEVAGIAQFLFTFGLVVGLDPVGYRTRFCFPTYAEAQKSLKEWNGEGFPPGYWIKKKGDGDVTNPLIGDDLS